MKKRDNLDCLFLVTKSSKKTYQKLSHTYSAIEPPTWALLLAESTRSVGFKVNDTTMIGGFTIEHQFRYRKRIHQSIAGMSPSTRHRRFICSQGRTYK